MTDFASTHYVREVFGGVIESEIIIQHTMNSFYRRSGLVWSGLLQIYVMLHRTKENIIPSLCVCMSMRVG